MLMVSTLLEKRKYEIFVIHLPKTKQFVDKSQE